MNTKKVTLKKINAKVEQRLFNLFLSGYSLREMLTALENSGYSTSLTTLHRIKEKYKWREKKQLLEEEIIKTNKNVHRTAVYRFQRAVDFMMNEAAEQVIQDTIQYVAELMEYHNGERKTKPQIPLYTNNGIQNLKTVLQIQNTIEKNSTIAEIQEERRNIAANNLTPEQHHEILKILSHDRYEKYPDSDDDVVLPDKDESEEGVHDEEMNKEPPQENSPSKKRKFSW